jgi:hypothetical protein
VYDVLGREVAVLFDGLQRPGRHEVVFDAGRLSSGMYFCVMKSGSFFDVKRMMLLR